MDFSVRQSTTSNLDNKMRFRTGRCWLYGHGITGHNDF
jgi:hypothetical protein